MDLKGARVAVTGGAGFLGKRIVEALTRRGAEALVPRRAEVDLREAQVARVWFARAHPDACIHAAATGGGIGFMRAHPARALTDNVLLNMSVLDAAHRSGVGRFVGVSSACAYGVDAPQPMREDAVFDGVPEPTNGPYGYAKRLMLVAGAAYAAEHHFDCAFVVPTNLYGPGDDFDLEKSHVVAALIRRFEEAKRNRTPKVTVWGTGRATRDLLHVGDAAEGVVRLLEVGGGPAPVNLGSGVERSVEDIVASVAAAVGYSGEVAWDPTRPDGMPRKVLDTGRARERLGWRPRIPFEIGLGETVAWYRQSSS